MSHPVEFRRDDTVSRNRRAVNEEAEPIVSVVIPVYNHEEYIRESVESALSQDYDNLEVIVVDDGSTDATPEVLKTFGSRIRYIRQKNKGTAAALNTGIRHAQGSLIAWLSSDDVFLPGMIKRQVAELNKEPSFAMVYADFVEIDSHGKELRVVRCPFPPVGEFAIELLKGNFINGSSVLIRKGCFEQVGLFDESLPTDSDGDMWFRLLKNGYEFGHIPEVLVKYRWHSSNLSHKYKLHHYCKDRVRVRALRAFSDRELFSKKFEEEQGRFDLAYEKLALVFARQFLFRAAGVAVKKSMQTNFALRGCGLWLIFRVMSMKVFLSPLLSFRFWLGRLLSFRSWLGRSKSS